MPFWSEQVVPRVIDLTLSTKPANETRQRVCRGLAGEVLEIGFGAGNNVAFLPSAVTRLLAVEPSKVARRRASRRVSGAAVPVDLVGLDGQRLDLPDGSVDAALSTWTLCTIPAPAAAVAEVYRVLRPGRAFHFVEHGLAEEAAVRRRQQRWTGLQQRLAGGCHLERDIAGLLTAGGFEVTRLERYYEQGAPKAWGAMYEGIACRPG